MKYLYRYSFSEAEQNNEVSKWQESINENIRCRLFLDGQIREKFDGMFLPDECAENAIKEFGYDRTMWVIANTILERDGDGRFSRSNQEWAASLGITESEYEFALNSHSSIVDGLANDVRKIYSELNLFSHKHIAQSYGLQDYTGKLLVLEDTVLREESRTPENQLFLATKEFYFPDISEKQVYGQFLYDGVKTSFGHSDFIGILADKHIPDWAKEKMEEIQQRNEAESTAETVQAEEAEGLEPEM